MNQAIVDLCRRHGFATAATLGKRLRISRQAAHRHLAAAVAAGELVATGQARARRYLPAIPEHDFEIAGNDEDRTLATVRERMPAAFGGLRDADERLLVYAFAEMVNNAIDHSRGTRFTVRLSIAADHVHLVVQDDGVGAFESVRSDRGLANAIEAAAEITKGKVTTMPARHSGEGVFFTSKAVDRFELAANGVALVVDNTIQDHAIRAIPPEPGTRVDLRFARPPLRTLQAVFAEWSEGIDFARTRTVVKLFASGRDFASRSEARRLLQGLESFREVVAAARAPS